MRRTGFDERRDQQVADEYLGDHMACRKCRAPTHRDESSTYGAQCRACFEGWCAEAKPRWLPDRPLTPPELAKLRERIRVGLRAMVAQQGNPRAWIEALKGREEQRAPLTPFQRQAWRDALGGRQPQEIDE